MHEPLHPALIEYYELGASLRETADHFNVSAATVMRLLRKHNKLRSKSIAQKEALKIGKATHPTKGQKRSDKTKLKISKGQVEAWDNIDDTEYKKRQQEAKIRWDNIPPEKKMEMNRRAFKGIKKAAKLGSKMELYIKDFLLQEGYNVLFHKKNILANTKLEVDILLPDINTVIELDGPSHYKPVWGEKALQRTIQADLQKDGLLLGAGFKVIRVQYDASDITLYSKTTVSNYLKETLEKIKNNELQDQKTILVRLYE